MRKCRTRVERRELADGTVKEYRYAIKPKAVKRSNTLAALVALWHDSPEWKKLNETTKTRYVRYLAYLYSEFKAAPYKDIKRNHLLSIRNGINSANGHGAAHGFCLAVSSLFMWAVDNEHLEVSPATRLRKGLDLGTLPTWTQEQANTAIAKLPKHYARAVQLAMHTSQRRGDLCDMRWSDYDGTYLTFIQEKGKALDENRKPHSILVNPELKRLLDAWKREARGLTILEGKDGTPLRREAITSKLPAELVKIGLPKGLNIHGLRKLAAVTMAENGCTTHEIAAVTGHKTLAMVELYTRAASQKKLSEAAVYRLFPVVENTKVANG